MLEGLGDSDRPYSITRNELAASPGAGCLRLLVLIAHSVLQNGRHQYEHQARFAIAKKIPSTRFHLEAE